MINKIKFTILLGATLAIVSGHVNAADIYYDPSSNAEMNSCGEVNDEVPLVTESSGSGIANYTGANLRCTIDLDALNLTLYKAALCTGPLNLSDPSIDWASKCAFIMDDDAGFNFTVTQGATASIPAAKIDVSTLVEATYTHAVLMVGRDVKAKLAAQFSEEFIGRYGSGRFCYSLDAVDPKGQPINSLSVLAANCVADEATMLARGDHDFSTNNIQSWYNFTSGDYENHKSAANGDEVYVFKDANTIVPNSEIEQTGANRGSSTATRVVGVMELQNPATVTANSSNFIAGFALSDHGMIRFAGRGSAGCTASSSTACITAMRNYAVGFRVSVE